MNFGAPADLANDILTAIYHWRTGESTPAAAPDPAQYLEKLRRRVAHLDIRFTGAREPRAVRIDRLYTRLSCRIAPPERSRKREQPEQPQSVPIQQEVRRHARVVLVGEPGAGKSTFLNRVAFAAVQSLLPDGEPDSWREWIGGDACPFPILLRASSLSEYIDGHRKGSGLDFDSPEWLIRYLDHAAREDDCGLPPDFFRGKLSAGCLLMVDGLDEPPDAARRENIASLLERTQRAYDRCRILTTSRPSAYGGKTALRGFASLTIEPLDREAVDAFAWNWCHDLYPDDDVKARERQRDLVAALRTKREIEDMASNPVMLTALAALHWSERRLPEQRAALYGAVLEWLGKARESRGVDKLDLMQHLAFRMQCGEKRVQEIGPHEAALKLADRFHQPTEEERIEAASRFLRDQEMESGILVARGQKLAFWHLTFQEYLAARALAARYREADRLLFEKGKLWEPDWHETLSLYAGILKVQDSCRVDEFLEAIIESLGAKPALPERARAVGLIGRILRDLASWGYRWRNAKYDEHLDSVKAIFTKQGAAQLDFATRLAAADAFGLAGDPRLEDEAHKWVKVEGGTFWMGSQDRDPNGPNYDPDRGDGEDLREETVETFWMSRYPVTVQEYEKFVSQTRYERIPGDWEQQLRCNNRPVVSVSWHDAMKYCEWAKTKLPTEAQWEYAARHGRNGERCPWGSATPDEQLANFAGPPHPTPVGMYPAGASTDGIEDLAGNIWEWTTSDWNRDASERQSIRGGAFHDDARNLRVSCRFRYHPGVRNVYIGFRPVRDQPPR